VFEAQLPAQAGFAIDLPARVCVDPSRRRAAARDAAEAHPDGGPEANGRRALAQRAEPDEVNAVAPDGSFHARCHIYVQLYA
jgi:hypothetical protein